MAKSYADALPASSQFLLTEHERTIAFAEAWIFIAHIRLLIRRLARA